MTYHDLSRLMTKLLGLFIIASTFVALISTIPALQIQETTLTWKPVVGYYVVPSLICLIVGLIFLHADKRIADTIVIKSDSTDQTSSIDYLKVEAILIALLGLYLTATALPSLLSALVQFVFHSIQIDTLSTASLYYVAERSVQVFIGIGLILGSNGLTVWLHRLLNFRHKVQTWDTDK